MKETTVLSVIQCALSGITVMQWQAGSRQQVTLSGFEPDKSNWGWNWLERWMAVRPWENRFLDINLKDGVKICENGPSDVKNNASTTQFNSTAKRPTINIANGKGPRSSYNNSNVSNEKTAGSNHSDGCSSSPNKSTNVQETPGSLFSSKVSKPVVADSVEEATSRPNVATRSHSNPRERSNLTNQQGKKRLSLPGIGLSLSLSIVFLARSFSKKFFFLQFDLNMARSWGSTSQGTKCSEKVPYYSKTLERQSQIEWFRCKAFKT